jgi:hypothetical protein
MLQGLCAKLSEDYQEKIMVSYLAIIELDR